jgi:DnaJ homolog subfamily C member 7
MAQASSPAPQQPQQTNGYTVPINHDTNGQETENGAPTPPPHKSKSPSPVPDPAEQAEGFKAEGNKAFQAKDYKLAIEQYTKGMV